MPAHENFPLTCPWTSQVAFTCTGLYTRMGLFLYMYGTAALFSPSENISVMHKFDLRRNIEPTFTWWPKNIKYEACAHKYLVSLWMTRQIQAQSQHVPIHIQSDWAWPDIYENNCNMRPYMSSQPKNEQARTSTIVTSTHMHMENLTMTRHVWAY